MAKKRKRKRGNPLPSSVMKQIWRKCGSPRSNPKCWSREMKKAHARLWNQRRGPYVVIRHNKAHRSR